eukprot:scaffold4024_cov123-Skeletonema_dohrnii-CCMP3373.AAC.1
MAHWQSVSMSRRTLSCLAHEPDSLPSAHLHLARLSTLISLRLLALILCSNCSNNPARLLSSIGRHRQTTFCNPEHHFCLQNMPPRMVEAFH